MHAAPSEPRPIRVRKLDFPFADADVPRWWFYDNPLITHGSNGLNLLFPEGERFFIRSVKHYLDRIEDPGLLARIKGFFGQEGRHGHEHERANKLLERHGYDLSRFLALYDRWAFGFLEQRFPPILRLSTTVACEHFTATFAHNALTKDFVEGAHPIMQRLIRWHACEEIEHKSVAFDVLKTVDPRYSIRVAGLVIATTQLVGWWILATRLLVEQEGLSKEDIARYRAEAERLRGDGGGISWEVIREAFVEYLRPDFHPDDRDDYHLARDYLASIGEA